MAPGDTVRRQMDIEFRHILVAHQIAHAGSIARAARTLGISQPAASELLARLERYFGQQIFTRSRAGVEPTAFGQDFLAGSRHVLPIFSDLLDELASRKRVTGRDLGDETLRFGGVASPVTTAVMTGLVTHQRSGGVKLRQDLDPDDLVALLGEGRLELAVVINETISESSALPPGVASHALGAGVWAVAVGPRHRLSDKSQVELDDIKHEHWLLSSRLPSSAKTALYRACSAAGFLPHVIGEVEPSSVSSMIAKGSAIWVDVATSAEANTDGRLHLTDGPPPVHYLLAWRTDGVTRREIDISMQAGMLALGNGSDGSSRSPEPLGPDVIVRSSLASTPSVSTSAVA